MRRLHHQPLLIIGALGVLLGVAATAFGAPLQWGEHPHRIVVTWSELERERERLAAELGRQPAREELRLALDERVRDRVLLRRARQSGLEGSDDRVVAMMRARIELLAGAEAAARAPDEEEVRAYLALVETGPDDAAGEAAFRRAEEALVEQARQAAADRLHHDASSDFRVVHDRRVRAWLRGR